MSTPTSPIPNGDLMRHKRSAVPPIARLRAWWSRLPRRYASVAFAIGVVAVAAVNPSGVALSQGPASQPLRKFDTVTGKLFGLFDPLVRSGMSYHMFNEKPLPLVFGPNFSTLFEVNFTPSGIAVQNGVKLDSFDSANGSVDGGAWDGWYSSQVPEVSCVGDLAEWCPGNIAPKVWASLSSVCPHGVENLYVWSANPQYDYRLFAATACTASLGGKEATDRALVVPYLGKGASRWVYYTFKLSDQSYLRVVHDVVATSKYKEFKTNRISGSVYAAGTFFAVQGSFTRIDNCSGHFKPSIDSLEPLAGLIGKTQRSTPTLPRPAGTGCSYVDFS
jgi:hypothetical protein